ncbi:MAG: polysaccharide deacetylase [Lachnospiraceae bacterium]|nr:polysaccharide deacetylase [Lachnospiraceae bacterium]MDD6858510.1 polysaccharide deacetylase [Lachnospiraceae bacterium]
MKNTKKRATIVLGAIACIIAVSVATNIILAVNLKSEKNKTGKYTTEINKLKKEKESLAAQGESEAAKEEQAESEKESLAAKNEELESTARMNGIREPLDENEKIVFLTFDDGPSDLTPEYLNVLKSYGVNATFFVTYQPDYEDTYKQIINDGNVIQIHTATHDYDTVYASVESYMNDFNTAYDYVCQVTGTKPTYFRFPGGSTSSYGKSLAPEIARQMRAKGFDFVDWNVSVGDGSNKATKDSILQKVPKESEGRKHIVLLAHDSATKAETLAALPQVIEYYRDNGYTFKVIDNNIDMSFAQFIDY